MQPIKAIIFDFGGVLMRTGDPAGRREWEARLGLIAGELEAIVHGSKAWINAQVGSISIAEYWAWIMQSTGVSPAELPAMRTAYFRDDRLDPDLVTLIKTLRGEGYQIGLLSNDTVALEDKLRHELAIYDLFDAVRISAQIGMMKPDPGAYQAICEALGIQANESIFIDDNPANVEGARAVGMHAIHYRAGMDIRAAVDALLTLTKGKA